MRAPRDAFFFLCGIAPILAFLPKCEHLHLPKVDRSTCLLRMSNDNSEGGNNHKTGYKFGDISRSLGKAFGDKVKELTGKEEYQFGDLSRWADTKVKDQLNEVTGKDDYEFGDLSRWIDSRVKDKVNDMTGKWHYSNDPFI